MRYILVFLILILLLPSTAFAVKYYEDVNCMGAWEMEYDAGNDEIDVSGESGDLSVSASDSIPRNADRVFGSYSRDFELDDNEGLSHGDANSTDISGVDQPLSIVSQVKWENTTITTTGVIVCKRYQNPGFQLYLRADDVVGALVGISNGDTAFAAGATDVVGNPTAWVGIVAVYNDTDLRIYVDGSVDTNGADNPKAYTSGIIDTTVDFEVGNFSAVSWPFDGFIDDVAVFDRELTSIEVSDIHTNGIAAEMPGGPSGAPQVIIICDEYGEEKQLIIRNYKDWLEYAPMMIYSSGKIM